MMTFQGITSTHQSQRQGRQACRLLTIVLVLINRFKIVNFRLIKNILLKIRLEIIQEVRLIIQERGLTLLIFQIIIKIEVLSKIKQILR